ncbi:MAG: FRG domain-containing protein [Bacteroidota bacterium]
MKDIAISSLEHYIKQITGFSDVFFYRGVNDSEYPLIPSVGRFGIKISSSQIQFERSLIDEFIRKAPIFSELTPKNDLDWLILAQHHGIPTRLMD